MLRRHPPSLILIWYWGCAWIFLCELKTAVEAGEIHLKNGTVIHGDLRLIHSLSDRTGNLVTCHQLKPDHTVPHEIALIQSDWQRIQFPLFQIQIAKTQFEGSSVAPDSFRFTFLQDKRLKSHFDLAHIGPIQFVDSFSEFGRRTVRIESNGTSLNLFQAITEVAPDHFLVESGNYDWKFGLALKSIPFDCLDRILRNQIGYGDPLARLGLARFYAQAEYFQEASEELTRIVNDFPETQVLVERSLAEISNEFGRLILRRCDRQQQAGQNLGAEHFVKKMLSHPLSGSVRNELCERLQMYDQSRQTIELAKQLLGECQSKLNNIALEIQVRPFRSEVNEQLNIETLPRLDAFLKAERDEKLKPKQRLALAYSGWVLGAAHATDDLSQITHIWDARNLVIEYLLSDDPGRQYELITELRAVEGICPSTVLAMIPFLPPILDASDIVPGMEKHVDTDSHNQTSYSVLLPPEYSHHHKYPLLIAMRSFDHTTEQTLALWAGDDGGPDLGRNRGYIVISPNYAQPNQREYEYDAKAHKYVLDCLADARNRFAVDSDRVFLAGHGMGADAAFDIGFAHPDEFAGVLPICPSDKTERNYSVENGSYTSWYVIGNGYSHKGIRNHQRYRLFDRMMKHLFEADFTLVEYLGRRNETFSDAIPKLYDWMDLHERPALARSFKVYSRRKSVNHFFWVTAFGLPYNDILQVCDTANRSIKPAEIVADVTSDNVVHLKLPTKNYALQLMSGMIDFEKRLIVKVDDRADYHDFVKPDFCAILQDLRIRGDRKRLSLAVLLR